MTDCCIRHLRKFVERLAKEMCPECADVRGFYGPAIFTHGWWGHVYIDDEGVSMKVACRFEIGWYALEAEENQQS